MNNLMISGRRAILALLASALVACGGGVEDGTPQPKQGDPGPMAYGLSVTNANGQLTISDSLPSFHFLGQATYQGASADTAGGLEYTITSPGGAPLPFVEVSPGGARIKVLRVENTAGNTWRVVIFSSAGIPNVWCFAKLASTSPADSWGVQVLDASGAVTFDSTRKPLALTRVVQFPGVGHSAVSTSAVPTNAQAVPTSGSESRPAIFAGATLGFRTIFTVSGGMSGARTWAGTVRLEPSQATREATVVVQGATLPPGSAPTSSEAASTPEAVLIIDIAKYL